MNGRPTPETDFEKQTLEEWVKEYEGTLAENNPPWYLIHEETAKKLERERDEARDIGEKLSKQGLEMMDENRTLKRERDEAMSELSLKQQTLTIAEGTLSDLRKELKEWQTLCLWGGTPEHIHDFIKGQQTRIHEAQDIEKTCDSLERERDEARDECKAIAEKLDGIKRLCDKIEEKADWFRIKAGQHLDERDEAQKTCERYRKEANAIMLQRDEAIEEATRRKVEFDHLFHANELAKQAIKERDEAQEELSSIYRWVERHNQDGFDDKLTHRQNIDICYDLLYDRLDMAELELNRIKRAVIATLDENRHLADGMNCTLIKLKTVVPTWK